MLISRLFKCKADSLPTNARELLNDYGLMGCYSSKSNDPSVHAKINSSGYIGVSWESDDEKRN